ncbi:MAG: ABC transporter permease [Planctomycetia bacterium]|nr:ABC transporter permease [Planctomycetia bacterium]
MSSEAITEKRDPADRWQTPQEVAPSVMRQDVPTVARVIGVAALVFGFAPGLLAIVFDKTGTGARIPVGLGLVMALFGLAGMLYHAARDGELEIRRAYGVFALVWLLLAIAHAVYPVEAGVGTAFLPWGYVSLLVGLPFALVYARNEEDPVWRQRVIYVIGVTGVVLAGVGLIGGSIKTDFLLSYGLLLSLAGLAYLTCTVGLAGSESDLGYKTGNLVAAAGALVAIAALGRGLLATYGWLGVPKDPRYLVTAGILLIGLGLVYATVGLGLISDRQFIVLTRRELASFFCSPLAYIILIVFAVIAWIGYAIFATAANISSSRGQPFPEPIIHNYIWGFIPIVFVVLSVPLLTMRLFSEERRTQTLEVLLTAPVEDAAVVLSKFTAAMIMYLLAWLPYGLYLIALRVEGGTPFDYRPLVAFVLALLISGSGMVAMGLFFSSLTRNQLASGVLTALGMIALVGIYIVKGFPDLRGTNWVPFLTHFSFLDLWDSSLYGKLHLSEVISHISFAIFWLFATVKVLEARKWL